MKWMTVLIVCLSASLAMVSTDAQASEKHHRWHHHQVVDWHHHEPRHIVVHRGRHHHYARLPRHYRRYANTLPRGLVTVDTKAGIPITVSTQFAPKMRAFVQALVARGYHPRKITCFARHGHVRGSLHYRGEACDFDQGGWGHTASTMYHITLLATQLGLRDGCTFRDCGHIDAGPTSAPHHYNRYARNWPGVLVDEVGRTPGILATGPRYEPMVH
jgi:hypothetical protein